MLRFEIGVGSYPVKHTGDVIAVEIVGEKGRNLPLRKLTTPEIIAEHDKLPAVRGVPTVFAFDRVAQRLIVHPLPKGEYAVDVILDEGEHVTFGRVGSPDPTAHLQPDTPGSIAPPTVRPVGVASQGSASQAPAPAQPAPEAARPTITLPKLKRDR